MIGAAPVGSSVSASSLAQLTLSLVVIVGLIFALGWALKRFRLAGPRGRGAIAVLDELALGPRERIVLLRVGETQLLVGVAAGALVNLVPLAHPLVPGATPAESPFAGRLREFMKRPAQP